YLTQEAIWATLGFIANLPGGGHVVFDYADPPESFSPEARAAHAIRAARVAELGEAWLSYFVSEDLRDKMTGLGFSRIEDLGPREIAHRYFPNRSGVLPEKGGHVVHAATVPVKCSTPGA